MMRTLSRYSTNTLQQLSLGNDNNAVIAGGVPVQFLEPGFSGTLPEYFTLILPRLCKLELNISFAWHEGMSQDDHNGQDRFSVWHRDNNSRLRRDLSGVLCLAQNLEELSLSGAYEIHYLYLISTFKDKTWKKLRHIDLKYFMVTEEGLTDFIKRHASSLRHMTIDEMRVISGNLRSFGTWIPAIAPDLELIFSLSYTDHRRHMIDRTLELHTKDFDETGCKIKPRRKRKRGSELVEEADANKDEAEDTSTDDGADSGDDSYLEYSSDDSSPSTASCPSRKPDIDLLSAMTPEFRTKVDRLRERLPAYSIQECQNALLANSKDHDKARENLFRDFNRDAFVSAV